MSKKNDSKFALALKKDLMAKTDLVPIEGETDLTQTDLVVVQYHLKGWTAKRIAKDLGHSVQNVHRILKKPDAVQLVNKNRDYVYDELQALGERVIGVLRDGLESDSEATRLKCALGLVGRLAKPKGTESVDDKMTTAKFLQQININNLQVLNNKDSETSETSEPKVINHVGSNIGDS